MNQTALDFTAYPANPANYGTELWWTFEIIKARGEACGKDFKDNPDKRIQEYRTRVAALKHMMPQGWTITTVRHHGIKFVFYKIIKIGERSKAA